MRPIKATHRQIKIYNTQLVLKTIFDNDQVSRAQVARLTRLTRVTVSEIVAELIEQGLVAEVGRGPSTGGKAPILLSVVDDARHLISLDLAEGHFRGAVVNLRGQIRHAICFPLQGRDDERALELVYELVDALLDASERPALGIGIGAPGLVDTANGMVLQAVNLSWRDLPLRDLLAERYNLPVYLANDSQVTALAEHVFGEGETGANLVAVKIGRGIGAGILLNGRLFQGDGFGAGEIGHVRVVEDGLGCRCGRDGCLETVSSCHAMLQRARALAPAQPGSRLNQLARPPEEISFADLAQAFQESDELAREIALEAARFLGAAIAGLVSALNIEQILLIGEVCALGAEWLETVNSTMRARSLAALAEGTQVSYGRLGANEVVLGASALLLTRELGLSLTRFPGLYRQQEIQ